MLSTNANFDTYHALQNKEIVFYVKFDGVDYAIVNRAIPDTITPREYLIHTAFSGLSQKVDPEKGKATISGINFSVLDYRNEITTLISEDAYNFHRKKTDVYIGYVGMDASDFIQIFTGWVTGCKLSSDGLAYQFELTDPKKWLQRKVFRNSRTTPTSFSGNPINILLSILTSTGTGTNGTYDSLSAEDGIGLSTANVNVTELENIRNDWYPGDSHYLSFTIDTPQKAGEFIEKEILQLLNAYPIIDGQGRYSINPFKPPLETTGTVQSFGIDNIIGLPSWNANLDSLINEVEFQYDHDGDDYLTIAYYADGTSITARGPGKDTLTIKTKGLKTDYSPKSIASRATDILQRRKNAIFNRYANPPFKITANCHFTNLLTEAGDIVPLTHPRVPNFDSGQRGVSAERMEVVSVSPKWSSGTVSVELLATGFGKNTYGVIGASGHVIGSNYYICQ